MLSEQHRPNLLDVPISVFRQAFNTIPEGVTTLRRMVSTKAEHHRPAIEAIRAEPDEDRQKELKKQLHAFTPVALLYHRKADASLADKINQQWPLLVGDVDQKDNPDVDMSELKKHLCRLPYVLLCAYSVRGGLWFVVRLPDNQTPDTLAAHFRYLQRLFGGRNKNGTYYGKFGVHLDASKDGNPTHLRYVSYDTNPYLNENATVMHGTYTPPKVPNLARRVESDYAHQSDEGQLLARVARMAGDATEGGRHTTLLKAARLAGGYVAAGRMDERTAVYALETVASEWPTFSKSQKTIRDGINYGLEAPICSHDQSTKSTLSTVKPLTQHSTINSVKTDRSAPYTTPTLNALALEKYQSSEPDTKPKNYRLSIECRHPFWQYRRTPPFVWNKIKTHLTLQRMFTTA